MNFEELIRRTWRDAAFKQEFLDNPAGVLTEMGIELAEGIQVFAHDQSDNMIHLVLQEDIRDEGTGFEDILRRAISDDAFKAEFMHDPKALIERETGVDLPDEIEIYVHEQTDTEVHLVLPLPPEA